MKMIISIPTKAYNTIGKIKFLVGGKEDRELQLNIINAFKNGTPLPDNATNGDVIRAMFPKTIFIQEKRENKLYALMISDEWWNAPYAKEQNNE